MYNRPQVFIAACIALFIFGMTFITLGSILPTLKLNFESRGLNEGLLASILPVGILAGSLVFGPIVDRYGYKLVLILSVVISAIALEALAFTNSVRVLYAGIFFSGFGGGIINGSSSALVSDISSENKAANLSLLGVFFGIGAFGLPFVLGVLSRHYQYGTILAAAGVFMILPLIYFLITRFPLPKQSQGLPIKQGIRLLKQPALLLTGFFLFFQSAVESLVNIWTTSFLQHSLSISNEAALYALSFSIVGLTVARIVLGGLLKKVSSITVMFFSLLMVATSCAVLLNAESYMVSFAALVLTGAGLAAGFPVMLGYIGQLYASISGTAFSIAFVIALAGNTILNYLFGIIARAYSISYLPLMVLGCIICMMVLLLFIKQKVVSQLEK